MSDALTAKLAELSDKEDQIIALVNTDASALDAMQKAKDALEAQGNDSDTAAVGQVQSLIDRLTPLLTPAAPATDPAPVTDPNAAPPV